MADFNSEGLITPQDAPKLDEQMNSLFDFAKTTNVENQIEYVKDVESTKVESTEITTDISSTETQEETQEEIQVVDADRELLINKFKTETGFEGDIDLSLDGFIGVTKQIQDKLKTYEQDEEVRQFVEHKAKGGTIETFKALPKAPDFTNIREQLVPTNIELAENLVRENLKQLGMRPTLIEANINALKDSGELHEEATGILDTFEKESLDEYNAKIKEIEEEQQKQQLAVQESWNQVKTIFNGNVINGVSIPKDDLINFKNAVLPDKNGNSKIIEMRQALTVEQQLHLDYIIFKGFNVSNVKGAVGKPNPAKNELSLTMLTGGAAVKESKNNTNDLLNELATQFSK